MFWIIILTVSLAVAFTAWIYIELDRALPYPFEDDECEAEWNRRHEAEWRERGAAGECSSARPDSDRLPVFAADSSDSGVVLQPGGGNILRGDLIHGVSEVATNQPPDDSPP